MDASMVPFAFAIFLLVGAFFGWRAGSKASLYAGLGSAVLVSSGGLWAVQDPKNGYIFLTTVAAGLTFVFLSRLMKTKKIMPSGMLFVVSALFLAYCVMHLCPSYCPVAKP